MICSITSTSPHCGRPFTQKPFLIPETGSEPGGRKPADINSLFQGVDSRDDVLGCIWFNIDKESNWRIDSSSQAEQTFRKNAADDAFGFNPSSAH
ncbi:hypothetical protein H9Y04_09840 [Streptomyces sp. TRM66268-LWL]|uniref:Uncharacterized protein n=1 Tax=Streptomyces polyasparticus TaxID=2767826 RepID=A0ABR7SE67_9ACTN|nr:hypothetical protein [Streptomyces polyasparticus]MBC9712872.1 hypothetical protein [Streptomyces polyasparticus]